MDLLKRFLPSQKKSSSSSASRTAQRAMPPPSRKSRDGTADKSRDGPVHRSRDGPAPRSRAGHTSKSSDRRPTDRSRDGVAERAFRPQDRPVASRERSPRPPRETFHDINPSRPTKKSRAKPADRPAGKSQTGPGGRPANPPATTGKEKQLACPPPWGSEEVRRWLDEPSAQAVDAVRSAQDRAVANKKTLERSGSIRRSREGIEIGAFCDVESSVASFPNFSSRGSSPMDELYFKKTAAPSCREGARRTVEVVHPGWTVPRQGAIENVHGYSKPSLSMVQPSTVYSYVQPPLDTRSLQHRRKPGSSTNFRDRIRVKSPLEDVTEAVVSACHTRVQSNQAKSNKLRQRPLAPRDWVRVETPNVHQPQEQPIRGWKRAYPTASEESREPETSQVPPQQPIPPWVRVDSSSSTERGGSAASHPRSRHPSVFSEDSGGGTGGSGTDTDPDIDWENFYPEDNPGRVRSARLNPSATMPPQMVEPEYRQRDIRRSCTNDASQVRKLC